jgi:hypothetical protein
MATITFVVFAVAFALPGLITVLLGGTAEDVAEFRSPPVRVHPPPRLVIRWSPATEKWPPSLSGSRADAQSGPLTEPRYLDIL